MFDLSRQWGWGDLWPADTFWNVPGEPALMDLGVALIAAGLVVFAIRTRKGR